jgi:hypothetical protein
MSLLAFAYQEGKKKDIVVFRFIIEYSSLRDFYRPLGNNIVIGLFLLYEDF